VNATSVLCRPPFWAKLSCFSRSINISYFKSCYTGTTGHCDGHFL